MVTIAFHPSFRKKLSKIREKALKERILKQIAKIANNPQTGKPMRFIRKGTREVQIPPFRLSYLYLPEEMKIVLLELYHKDEQ